MELPLVVYRRQSLTRREELSVGPVSPRRRPLRIFDGDHQQAHRRRWAMALHGRAGSTGKTLAELKDGFAFDTVPTNHYSANSAWQQLSVFAMNLLRRLQIETMAPARPRTRKTTFLYVLESIKTARFTWLNVAGRSSLPMGQNAAPDRHYCGRKRYQSLERALARAHILPDPACSSGPRARASRVSALPRKAASIRLESSRGFSRASNSAPHREERDHGPPGTRTRGTTTMKRNWRMRVSLAMLTVSACARRSRLRTNGSTAGGSSG